MTGLAARRELTGRWDLRLVGAALGCWLTALVGLRLSATAGWLVAGVAVLAALILGRRAAAGMVWASVAAAVLLGVACGAAGWWRGPRRRCAHPSSSGRSSSPN